MERDNVTTTDGQPAEPGVVGAPKPINPATGQHGAYYILTEEERAKGFVRPVRRSYRHVGAPGPKFPLRDLTPEEVERGQQFGYVKYEPYPDGYKGAVVGRFWTQAQLDKIGRGCGTKTSMGLAIAETYARQPTFYGATFCCHCGTHLPVGEQGEFVWEDGSRVGT
jgi:hypothetical protein